MLFGFPAGLHLVEFIFIFRKLRAQLLKAFLGELVGLLFKRHFFDFKLHYLTANVVKLRRHGVNIRANGGAGLVHKVNGLIRKKTVGDIAVGKGSRRHKGAVVNTNAVVNFVALFKTSQNGNGVLHGGFVHHYGLETAFQGGVLFNILSVFVKGGGAYAVQLASGKHGLEQVACVHAALGFACAHYGVQLVDEQKNFALGLFDFLKHRLESFLKFAAVLCAGDKGAHIKAEDGFILQPFRNVPPDYTLSKPLGNGGFTYAGFADEHGIVLRLS